ncbi:MAG: sigma-70 family RNA polymerase sigma factor [Gemmataceae bacterium]
MFRIPEIEQLADQIVRFTPQPRRRGQWARACQLLSEIDVTKSYPYQYVVFRITEYRTDTLPDLMFSGKILRDDLITLIDRLDRSLPAQPIEESEEPMITLEQLSEEFHVSTKTVRRWKREHNLLGWRVLYKGRRHLGFPRSAVEKFAQEHKEQVERGAHFTHLTDDEKEFIILRARRIGRVGGSLTEASRRIARRLERSVEAIRYTIRNYDRMNPGHELFPGLTGPLDGPAKEAIFNSYRRGVPVVTLAKRYGRNRNTVYRAINEVRATRLLRNPVDYIYNAAFDDPAQAQDILGAMPDFEKFEAQRAAMKAPRDVPPELAPLYEMPLLTREQEAHLFRQMNYLKHMLKKATDAYRREDGAVDPEMVRTADLDRIEELHAKIESVRAQLIACNMRLVVSIAKRHGAQTDNFFELLSDGNMSLMRAVEKFDYGRGNKFSTYASWAIMKNFARSIPEEKHQRERYITGHDEVFDAAPDARTDEAELVSSAEQAAHRVNRMLEYLEPREREIIRMRAGLDQPEGMTLEQIGKRLGITKERVRQLNVRIMKKLRDLAVDQGEA